MTHKKKKVYVGLSGGVDSSVSAFLLKEQGHDVTGVFIKVWHPDFLECTWKDDRRDAMRICAHLNIPFKTFDFEEEYKKEVVDYMISEYKEGRTPNPDVMCNMHVKFGVFLKKALEEGADFVATGHYARTRKVLNSTHDTQLLSGIDTNKDQSYFLWKLTQEQLQRIVFPIGEMEKNTVREIAHKNSLITADKKDSQGICFVGHVDMKDFLKRFIETQKGEVLDTQGKIIGHHEGALLYTIGQRHGYTITKKTPNEPRLFVVDKDVTKNTITVAPIIENENSLENGRIITLSNINWINEPPQEKDKYVARIRYRQPLQKATILVHPQKTEVVFSEPQKALAKGQSLVLYKDDVVVGGGIIEDFRLE
jgi:tRNA-uridine 2-sulfurtransferase